MQEYFTYILLCSDNSYYTGVTNNLELRIAQHQAGFDIRSYTYSRRPVTLAYQVMCNNVQQAIALEKQIKGWSRAKKKALIDENWDLLKLLSIAYNKR